MLGGCPIKAWSKTQPTIALSVGEAEWIAIVKAGAESLGIQSLLRDLGEEEVYIQVQIDSSTGKSIASRRGAGRVRHLETQDLWVQEAVRRGKFEMKKICRKKSPSDLCTKPKCLEEINLHGTSELLAAHVSASFILADAAYWIGAVASYRFGCRFCCCCKSTVAWWTAGEILQSRLSKNRIRYGNGSLVCHIYGEISIGAHFGIENTIPVASEGSIVGETVSFRNALALVASGRHWFCFCLIVGSE